MRHEYEGLSKKALISLRTESKRPETVCFKAVKNKKDILILQCVISLWDSLPQGCADTGELAGCALMHNRKIISTKKCFCLCVSQHKLILRKQPETSSVSRLLQGYL